MSFDFTVKQFILGGGTGTPTFQFYRRGFNLGGSGSQPSWKDVILHGNTALTLVNSKANGLNYLKLFGGTELLPETYIDSVTAEGKCVQTNVPKEYTQYEYLQSSGTQYIDTGIPVKANTYVRAEFEFTNSTSSTRRLFGKIAGSSTGAMNYREYASFYWFQSNSITSTSSGKHVVEFKSDGNVYLDGTVIGTRGTFSQGSNSPMYLFAELSDNSNINYGSVKVYRFTVSEDTTVVLDLIPCKRNSDDVLGMYDKVSGNFLINQGTGDFTGNVGGSPTPTNPVDIVCNNGTISFPKSAVGTVSQAGTPTPDTPVEPVFYNKGGMVLRAIDTDTDSYDSATQTITRAIGYHIFDGTETFGSSTAYGKALYISNPATGWGANRSKDVLCQYFLGASSPSNNMPEYSCFFNASGHFYFRTSETATNFKAWLAELYDNGTPLIVWFVKSTSTTESFTPSIYVDGTVETVTDSNGLTATAQMLLGVGDYKDTQEVLTGAVTRNVGIKVFDGTESFAVINNTFRFNLTNLKMNTKMICSHFDGDVSPSTTTSNQPDLTIKNNQTNNGNAYIKYTAKTTVGDFQQWLADQYNAGTPVIVVFQLIEPTTETVSGQLLLKSPVTYSGSISGLTGTVVESSHTTPTPTQPLQINCNNGVVRLSPNLFKVSDITTSTVSDVTVSASSDGTITANGTSSSPNYSQFVYALSNPITEGTYTVSLYNADTLANGSLVGFAINTTVGTRGVSLTTANNVKTITVNQGETCNNVIIRIAGTANQFKFKIQIEKGDQGTPYHNYGTTYVDGTTETVAILKNYAETFTLSDEVPNQAGSQMRAGTILTNLPAGTYRINKGGYGGSIYVYGKVGSTKTEYVVIATDTEITLSGTGELYIYAGNGVSVSALSNLTLEVYNTTEQTATAEMLLKVGIYQDVQSVLDGEVTRNVGVKGLDGTENWSKSSSRTGLFYSKVAFPNITDGAILCTHMPYSTTLVQGYIYNSRGELNFWTNFTDFTLDDWKQWLKDQYNSGLPVVVVYPLATPTTETVTGQPLTIQAGTNIVEITQASIDNLPLEVSYKAGVTVTVTEVENAQLSNSVEVTING